MIRIFFILSLLIVPFSVEAKHKKKKLPPPPPVGKEFVLFTMPKTGTHLISPFLHELTHRKRRWASALFRQEFAPCSEDEYAALIETPGKVPYFYHYRPIDEDVFIRAVQSITKSGRYFGCHTPYSEHLDVAMQKIDHVVIFLLRDPRDVALSGSHYYGKHRSCGLWKDSLLRPMNPETKILTMIRGLEWSNSLRQQVLSYTPWQHSPNCCCLRFEALVSPDREARKNELRKLADALDIESDDEELLSLFEKGIGKGPTFFQGKSGRWREEFSEEHIEIFEEELGDLMEELDYE